MNKYLFLFLFLTATLTASEPQNMTQEVVTQPQYLYKVLSIQLWDKSQNNESLSLPPEDDAFIHLSTDEQLDRIRSKFWTDVPSYVILKLDTAKLQGTLKFEANPGGTSKYYHLYNGSIPKCAIIQSKVITQ